MTPAQAFAVGALVGLVVGFLWARARYGRMLRRLRETAEAARTLEALARPREED